MEFTLRVDQILCRTWKNGCGKYWDSVGRMWEMWLLTWNGGIRLRVLRK